MNEMLSTLYIARHGETAWSLSGQHTGLTDLPLTERGQSNARLANQLRGRSFAHVFTSPLQRARRTCELAGFGAEAEVDRDLLGWNYCEYEGLRTAEILAQRFGWELFRDGCPGGESAGDVEARADRVVDRVSRIPSGCFDIFEWALSSRTGRTLAATRTPGWEIFPAEHSEPERAWL